ncbi:MAG: ribosome recycling factor [bacterium]|nr:ribosome recycling factor [bacterium]
MDEVLLDSEDRMGKAVDVLRDELLHIRTGKATTALLDGIKVDAYGQMMPLNQLATIGVPDPRLITVQPWDKSQVNTIEKAILASDLGFNPANDGTMIRIAIPQLTEERRKELVKVVHKIGEDSKISVRNIRRDANDKLKKLEKDKEIMEDELYKSLEEIQKLTDKCTEQIDKVVDAKDQEIMQV